MAIRERLTRKNMRLAAFWIVVLGAVGLITYWAIWANDSPPWTGFGQYRNAQGQLVGAKTLWDWLDLLIVPVVLAAGAWWLNRTEKRTELESAERRAATEMAVARDKQNHEILQDYFDNMADLLMSTDLETLIIEELDSESGEKAQKAKVAVSIARARTLIVLRVLDTDRVSAVFRFLYDTMIGDTRLQEIVGLQDGDLSNADWTGAVLFGTNLQGVVLVGANLQEAMLDGANLRGAWLGKANLQRVWFQKANLQGAALYGADLRDAALTDADLQKADLIRANLQEADLRGANLQAADLRGANLQAADLRDANLQATDLYGADVTPSQLLEAKSLAVATMPDGTKYEEWLERGKPDWTKDEAWIERTKRDRTQQVEDDDAT